MNLGISPCGKIDWIVTLVLGIDMIVAAGHVSIMASKESSFMLTPATKKYGTAQIETTAGKVMKRILAIA